MQKPIYEVKCELCGRIGLYKTLKVAEKMAWVHFRLNQNEIAHLAFVRIPKIESVLHVDELDKWIMENDKAKYSKRTFWRLLERNLNLKFISGV